MIGGSLFSTFDIPVASYIHMTEGEVNLMRKLLIYFNKEEEKWLKWKSFKFNNIFKKWNNIF